MLKRVTDKDDKNNKKQVNNNKKQRCESKVSKRIEDYGVNYEDELKKVRNRKWNSGKVMNFHVTTMLT